MIEVLFHTRWPKTNEKFDMAVACMILNNKNVINLYPSKP